MKLSELLLNVEVINVIGDIETNVFSVNFDSRKTENGSLFVAISGVLDDGNKYIDNAIENGARVVVCEKEQENMSGGIVYVIVKNSHSALAIIANNFFNNPSRKLKLIGVTGTNGKTTTVTLLFNLFRKLGFHCVLISTIENKIDDEVFEASRTTPDPISIASILASAVSKGCTHAFMECSSHAISQERIGSLRFVGAIFTNLTHDHLDYHKTIDEYARVKKQLFDGLPEIAFAIGNKDDEKGKFILQDTKAKKYFYSLNPASGADFIGNVKSESLDGQKITINGIEIYSKLPGKFNAYNLLAIFATAKLLGLDQEKIITEIKSLVPAAGRLEFYKSNSGVYGVIDYAHTPDALQNVLETLKNINLGKGKIITVVGCGGDRDTSKRGVMGQIACSLSDYVIFSSDNPRNEDPEHILQDIVKNLVQKNYEAIVDRATAITKACEKAKPGDIILLAGKGPEKYQIIKDQNLEYNDLEELKKNLKIDS